MADEPDNETQETPQDDAPAQAPEAEAETDKPQAAAPAEETPDTDVTETEE